MAARVDHILPLLHHTEITVIQVQKPGPAVHIATRWRVPGYSSECCCLPSRKRRFHSVAQAFSPARQVTQNPLSPDHLS